MRLPLLVLFVLGSSEAELRGYDLFDGGYCVTIYVYIFAGSCALTKLNSKKKTIHLARVPSKLRKLFYQTSNTEQ